MTTEHDVGIYNCEQEQWRCSCGGWLSVVETDYDDSDLVEYAECDNCKTIYIRRYKFFATKTQN